MHCVNCGSKIEGHFRFCPDCGNEVGGSPSNTEKSIHLYIEHKNLFVGNTIKATGELAKSSVKAIIGVTKSIKTKWLPRILKISLLVFSLVFISLAIYSKQQIVEFNEAENNLKKIDFKKLFWSHYVSNVFVNGNLDLAKNYYLDSDGERQSSHIATFHLEEFHISYVASESYKVYFNKFFGDNEIIKITKIEKINDNSINIILENNLRLHVWKTLNPGQYVIDFTHQGKEIQVLFGDESRRYSRPSTSFHDMFGFDLFPNETMQ